MVRDKMMRFVAILAISFLFLLMSSSSVCAGAWNYSTGRPHGRFGTLSQPLLVSQNPTPSTFMNHYFNSNWMKKRPVSSTGKYIYIPSIYLMPIFAK